MPANQAATFRLSTGRSPTSLPVWMLHTKWQGKDYLFAMNGQTGSSA